MKRTRSYLVFLGAALLLPAFSGRQALAAGEIKMRYLYEATGFSSSQPFVRPSGVFFDTNRNELYVADTGNGQIVVLDKEGTPVARIPHTVTTPSGDRRTGEPRSIVVRKNGDILVVDGLCGYVDVLDFRGRSVQKVWPADLLNKPRASIQPLCLAMDAQGNVYLAVKGHTSEILVLSPDLEFKAEMGVESTGESRSVTGLWADREGRVYATYASGVCVRIFAPDGKLLAGLGAHESGPNNFSLPSGLITDGNSRLWAVDALRHVVSVFQMESDNQGLKTKFVSLAIGGTGRDAGNLTFPSAITGDGARRLFVVESTGARVQGFEILPEPTLPISH